MAGKSQQKTGDRRDTAGRFAKGVSGNPSGRPRKVDSWSNTLSGVGQDDRDPSKQNSFTADVVTPTTARELWQGDDIAARIIEKIPDEMLRTGWTVSVKSDPSEEYDRSPLDDAISALEDLDFDDHLWMAKCYERAYGGAAILLGVNDGGAADQPLNPERVVSFDWLDVAEPDDLTPHTWYSDPTKPKFGTPETWQVNRYSEGAASETAIVVHETRMVTFPGIRVSKRQQRSNSGWGDSVFTRVFRVLSSFNLSWESVGILLQRFAIATFKIKGLAELVLKDQSNKITDRMRAAMLSQSILGATLIDADGEEFERKQVPVSGLPELLDKFAARLAAAADMPLTLLMGISPGGLNATGESDIRSWYDRVASQREKQFKRRIEYVVRIMMAAQRIQEPDSWCVKFNPLWQPTEKELAESRNIQAKTDETYIANQVYSPDDVARSRFGGDEYSYETTINWQERDAFVAAAEQAAAEQAERDRQMFEAQLENGKSSENNSTDAA